MTAVFKGSEPAEQVLAPSGLFIVLRQNIGEAGWAVWVYNFATWKHRTFQFEDEASARTEFNRWLI